MIKARYRLTVVFVAGLLALAGCDNPTAATDKDPASLLEWTWISGNTIANLSGSYGAKGVSYPTSRPGARQSAVSWRDDNGDFWLFGGYGYDSGRLLGYLNDLWRFDGAAWTWVSGSPTRNESGTYGTKSVTDVANMPGGRYDAVSWRDDSGNLWLYGGYGYDSASGSAGYLNDLWRFDGGAWTWVSGSATTGESGTYGTKGEAGAANIPGARGSAASWRDDSGNLWLLGGSGHDSGGELGYLNDLWRFDGAAWTWVSGSPTRNGSGAYGTKGAADAANMPGARASALSWSDDRGNLWLFGGEGYDSASGSAGYLNDLWRFDGGAWTWVSGSATTGESGNYGTKGEAGAANIPGARRRAVSWTEDTGDLWLFGGYGYGGAGGSAARLNDLWRFDGATWSWVSGSDTGGASGTYGTKSVTDVANIPGARSRAVSWRDDNGNLWLFGGYGYDGGGSPGRLNDLWRFEP